jgi:hypothetical protein
MATPRVAVGVALSTPRAKDMPRAALGVDLATPTAALRRGSDEEAGQARPYAEGPDFWPSAYKRPSAYRAIPVVIIPATIENIIKHVISFIPCCYISIQLY